MFYAYKSVIVTPCACDLFVSKVTKITQDMDVCFWRSFFSAFFSGCDDCILKSTTAWLLKLSVLYIHSFMHIHNTTFQIKTVFNNVLFSTEVHNPLHERLLEIRRIYRASVSFVFSDCFSQSPCFCLALCVTVTLPPGLSVSLSSLCLSHSLCFGLSPVGAHLDIHSSHC